MVTLTNNNIAKAIYLSTKDKTGAELRDDLKDVAKFLARRRLISKSTGILESLEKIINKEDGVVVARVGSAEKLSHKTKEDLTHLLKKRFEAKSVVLEERIEENLLGGMRVEVNDEVLDVSIKNKIVQLQEYLERNI
jgi:F-type H+-transporting ATPase subunit delta